MKRSNTRWLDNDRDRINTDEFRFKLGTRAQWIQWNSNRTGADGCQVGNDKSSTISARHGNAIARLDAEIH